MPTPTTTSATELTLTISIPRPLAIELMAYAKNHDADLGWTLRRGARLLLDEEAEQAERAPTRTSRAAGPRRRR